MNIRTHKNIQTKKLENSSFVYSHIDVSSVVFLEVSVLYLFAHHKAHAKLKLSNMKYPIIQKSIFIICFTTLF